MTIIIHTLLSTQKIHNLTIYKLYSKQFFTNYPKFNKILNAKNYKRVQFFLRHDDTWVAVCGK